MEKTIGIPLRNKNGDIVGYTIIDEDVCELMNFTPCLNKDGYAQGKLNGMSFLLHRFVMEANKGDPKIDHINGNKLDNRRINLRFTSSLQNSQNRLKKAGTSSKFIGVHKRIYNYGIRWVGSIRINGKQIQKSFKDEEHAAYWYDLQVLNYHKTDDFEPKINGIERPENYVLKEDKNKSYGTRLTKCGNFEIRIQNENRNIHIGTFETAEKAKEAYVKKKEEVDIIKIEKKVGTEIIRNGENIAIMITNKGEEILVDDNMFFDLKKYTWILNTKGYAQGNIMGKTVVMHRYILNAPSEIKVDHINHNRLDNRIENLRLVDDSLNSHNTTKRKNKTSQYIGVYKAGNKFVAEIKKEGIAYNLGRYNTELEAAEARDKKAIELYGDKANLNIF